MKVAYLYGLICTAVFFSLITVGGVSSAAEPGTPSANEIIEKLKVPTRGLGQFRGVVIVPPEQQNPEINPANTDPNSTPVPAPIPAPAPPTINMKVVFKLNSSELTDQARQTLSELGKALIDEELSSYSFLIAGHTDASGNDSYNQSLSERRAKAVRDYLVYRYDIHDKRLHVVGYGESRLLDPDRPNEEVNRRVQITNLGK